LVLDGVKYHRVDTSDIPNGFASVPVKVDDNGTAYHTKMLAGAIGIRATSSGDSKLDTIQSLSGWFMFEVDKNAKTEDKPQLW
jgi:streptogramin lyase